MKTDQAGATDKPTDLELMLYADGELPEERLAAVEAYLAEDRTARQKMVALGIVSGVVRGEALAGAGATKGGGDIADLVMKSIAEAKPEPEKKADVVPLRPEKKRRAANAANDRARGGLWALAAFAAAAAAALLLWSRGQAPENHASTDRSAKPAITAPGESVKIEAPKPEGDVDHGVEVAAVNFGALTGAVFYVPGGSAASTTTTVVWLSDDSSGGNE